MFSGPICFLYPCQFCEPSTSKCSPAVFGRRPNYFLNYVVFFHGLILRLTSELSCCLYGRLLERIVPQARSASGTLFFYLYSVVENKLYENRRSRQPKVVGEARCFSGESEKRKITILC